MAQAHLTILGVQQTLLSRLLPLLLPYAVIIIITLTIGTIQRRTNCQHARLRPPYCPMAPGTPHPQQDRHGTFPISLLARRYSARPSAPRPTRGLLEPAADLCPRRLPRPLQRALVLHDSPCEPQAQQAVTAHTLEPGLGLGFSRGPDSGPRWRRRRRRCRCGVVHDEAPGLELGPLHVEHCVAHRVVAQGHQVKLRKRVGLSWRRTLIGGCRYFWGAGGVAGGEGASSGQAVL
jgi:hypothetical protein